MPDAKITELPAELQSRRQNWIDRVTALVNQVQEWSQAESWSTERHPKMITEKLLGTYTVPELLIRAEGGELMINPIGLHTVGGDGRVDVEAIPTLSRVKLVGAPEGWRIWTDSNVPLRVPWNRENLARLAEDLLA